MDAAPLYEPISLGATCETKFQIARALYFQRFPNKTHASLQLAMMPPARGRPLFPWRLFDCQGTTVPAICTYIERDFEGVFEREDLVGCAEGVVHRTVGANHLHEFEGLANDFATISAEDFAKAYAQARPQFDAMARRFRRMLTLPGPYLYVHACELFPPEAEIHRLIAALGSRSSEHRFHILMLGYEGEWLETEPYGGMVTAFHRPYRGVQPRKWNWWDIDYGVWDEALAPFRLGQHPVEDDPQQSAAGVPESMADPGTVPMSPPPAAPRLHRLLARLLWR